MVVVVTLTPELMRLYESGCPHNFLRCHTPNCRKPRDRPLLPHPYPLTFYHTLYRQPQVYGWIGCQKRTHTKTLPTNQKGDDRSETTYEPQKLGSRYRWMHLVENSYTEVSGPSEVDVDVRCPVLVPLLLCPPKGSLWGAVKA